MEIYDNDEEGDDDSDDGIELEVEDNDDDEKEESMSPVNSAGSRTGTVVFRTLHSCPCAMLFALSCSTVQLRTMRTKIYA